MSTMYDALRKAEAERRKAAGIEEKSPEAASKPSASVEIPKNTKTVILLIAVIIVFGIAFFRIRGLMGEAKRFVVQTARTAQVPVVIASLVKPQHVPGTYDLDGVIDAGANSMAIINGKLLKPEDTIDDLILKKVSPKEVELLNSKDNSTVVLKIK